MKLSLCQCKNIPSCTTLSLKPKSCHLHEFSCACCHSLIERRDREGPGILTWASSHCSQTVTCNFVLTACGLGVSGRSSSMCREKIRGKGLDLQVWGHHHPHWRLFSVVSLGTPHSCQALTQVPQGKLWWNGTQDCLWDLIGGADAA